MNFRRIWRIIKQMDVGDNRQASRADGATVGTAGTGSSSAGPPVQGLLARRCGSLAASAALAAAGAFLDAFTYVGHGRVFANAMTGNVVLLGVDALSGSWRHCLGHLLPILMFLLGVASARTARLPWLRRRLMHPELAVLAIEILVLLGLGWLPPGTSNFAITMSIAYAASLQMATFREIDGRAYSSTFTTGNLRTMIEAAFDWAFFGRQPTHLRATREFAVICSMFLVGAALGAFATPRLRNRALWIDVLLLAAVLAWLLDGALRDRIPRRSVALRSDARRSQASLRQ